MDNALRKLMELPPDWQPPTPEEEEAMRLAFKLGELRADLKHLCESAEPGPYGPH